MCHYAGHAVIPYAALKTKQRPAQSAFPRARLQQDLDQGEAHGLGGDGDELQHDAQHHEVYLAVRRDRDAYGDHHLRALGNTIT